MRNHTKSLSSAIILALCCYPVAAQADDTGFFASADSALAHDDNIYRVTDDLAQSDSYFSISPNLKLTGGYGKQRFEISYLGEYSKFNKAKNADFDDHKVKGIVELEHTSRFSSRLEAGYQKEHEEPGSINRIQLDIIEYNKYNQSDFLAGIAYGKTSGIGRLSLDFRKIKRDYTNNNLDYLNYDSDQFSSRFTYRIAPKTRLYVEAIYSEFDYQSIANFELDNKFKYYSAGLSWDFTNKLSGDINLGYQDRDYDLETIRDIDGIAYNGEILWSINTYSKIGIEATRESIDSSLEEAGGFLRTTYGLSINHKLTELLKVRADAAYSKDELVFNSAREDNRYAYSMTIDYELLRYLTLGAYYKYEERDSNNLLANYKANVIGLSISISLDE